MKALKKIDRYKKNFNDSAFKKKTMPKVLSVLFAVIFWLYVMDQVNPEMVRTIPNLQVEILNEEGIQSGGYVILEQTAPSVTVKIKGRRKAVMNIKAEDIILSADVKDFHKGINYFPIVKKIFADNVVVENLSEDRIQMNIDRLMEMTQLISIKTIGKLSEGESLGEIKVTPEQVVVRGPETFVKQVTEVIGEVDLSTIQNSTLTSVHLKAVDRNNQAVNNVTLSSNSVSATLGVLKENNAEIEADLVGTLPAGYKVTNIQIQPSSLSLKGQAENFVELKVLKTKPIDLTGMSGQQVVNTGLAVPSELQLQGIPETVSVTINIEKVEEKELIFLASDIKLLNMPTGMTVNLIDPNRKITVKVKAVASVLEQLENSDIQIEADAGEIKDGQNKIKVTASSNLLTESLNVVPSAIEVEGVQN